MCQRRPCPRPRMTRHPLRFLMRIDKGPRPPHCVIHFYRFFYLLTIVYQISYPVANQQFAPTSIWQFAPSQIGFIRPLRLAHIRHFNQRIDICRQYSHLHQRPGVTVHISAEIFAVFQNLVRFNHFNTTGAVHLIFKTTDLRRYGSLLGVLAAVSELAIFCEITRRRSPWAFIPADEACIASNMFILTLLILYQWQF